MSAVSRYGATTLTGKTSGPLMTPTLWITASIGADADSGVVDRKKQAFGYRNLIVCDGSAVPANIGANPSLTIAALAEHAITQVSPRA
jgi:cholesterol oxidase